MAKIFRESQPNSTLTDPTALARFGKLEVVARHVVEGFMIGQHKSPYKGSSVEFVEHRQYTPGDEIRHIDWRAFGKTDKYYVKEFEDETNLRCSLLVDASGSMNYGQSTLSKFDYARYLATALGYLLLLQRDAPGLVSFDTEIRDRFEPSSNPLNFERMLGALQSRAPGGETGLAKIFEQLLRVIKRRSLLVILSDCFDNVDDLARSLEQFRHAGHEVVLFHIVAPEEEEFPFSRPTQFHNLERTAQRLMVEPLRLRAHYLECYQEFCTQLARRCRNVGVEYEKLITTKPYDVALGAFLDSRSRRKGKR